MAITINYYPKKIYRFSTGLGQDVGSLRSMINIIQVFVVDSPVQRKAKSVMDWRMTDTLLREQLLAKMTKDPVRLTVNDLTAEYTKEAGKPAAWQIKCVLGAIVPGQKNARDADGNLLVDPEGKNYKFSTRTWPLRNFIGYAIGLNLLFWDRRTGEVSITKLGLELANVTHGTGEELSSAEEKVMRRVFMSYPYAVGFLKALKENRDGFNKFQLGEHFGFAGEAGFTSYGENLYIAGMKDAYIRGDHDQITKIRSNWEGTSDKYIRGLASVLSKLGLVDSEPQKISYTNKATHKQGTFSIPVYKLTGIGRENLGYALGTSKHPRSTKIVTWDMLATKGNVVYIRTIRALILKELSQSSGLTAEKLANRINENKINAQQAVLSGEVSASEVIDHIAGLNGIGLEIIRNNTEKYILKDSITSFEIPVIANDLPKKDEVQREQDTLRPLLKHVDHRYLQLVELALDSSQNSEYSQLESLTMELILKHLDFYGQALGGPNKPDGIAWDKDGNFLIVDTKAYNQGYSLAGNTDKVARYISDVRARDNKRISTWWKDVPETIDTFNKLRFMYVSGYFSGNYVLLLNGLRASTKSSGGLTSVEKLLLTAELYLTNNNYGHKQILDDWTNNKIDHDEYYGPLVDALSH